MGTFSWFCLLSTELGCRFRLIGDRGEKGTTRVRRRYEVGKGVPGQERGKGKCADPPLFLVAAVLELVTLR